MSIVTALSLAGIWRYGTRDHRLVDARLDAAHIRYVQTSTLLTPAVFVVSVAVAFVSVSFAMYCWVGVFLVGYLARRKATGARVRPTMSHPEPPPGPPQNDKVSEPHGSP